VKLLHGSLQLYYLSLHQLTITTKNIIKSKISASKEVEKRKCSSIFFASSIMYMYMCTKLIITSHVKIYMYMYTSYVICVSYMYMYVEHK
jgi:hypothetical protein